MKQWIHGMAAFGLIVLLGERAAAGTIVVSPTSLNGWEPFVTDDNGVHGANPNASVTFVTGPASPPLGVGSVNLVAGNGTAGGDGSAQISTANFAGTPLSSLTSLSYSTYVTSNNGQQFPYLKLNVDLGDGTYDQLFFEPPYQTPGAGDPSLPDQGATQMNTWQSWNALEGGWWDNNGVLGSGGFDEVNSLAAFEALYPNATLANDSTDGLYAISLRVGYASPGDAFDGNVDNFTIGYSVPDGPSSTTTYDFDPASPAPEPATCTMLGIGLLSLAGYRRRRKQTAA